MKWKKAFLAEHSKSSPCWWIWWQMHPGRHFTYTDHLFKTFPHTVSSTICFTAAAPTAANNPDRGRLVPRRMCQNTVYIHKQLNGRQAKVWFLFDSSCQVYLNWRHTKWMNPEFVTGHDQVRCELHTQLFCWCGHARRFQLSQSIRSNSSTQQQAFHVFWQHLSSFSLYV